MNVSVTESCKAVGLTLGVILLQILGAETREKGCEGDGQS